MKNKKTPIGLDESDMLRLAAGEDEPLNALIERFKLPLYHFLLRLLHNEADAADVAQETFVRIYQHRQRYDPSYKFAAWLFSIANNLAHDHRRSRSRHRHISLEQRGDGNELCLRDQLIDQTADSRKGIQSKETGYFVSKAITGLPDSLRIPLILSVYQEFTQAEIAEILQCTVKAVETRIYRARKRIRKRLESWNIMDPHGRKAVVAPTHWKYCSDLALNSATVA